jgi:hypothetical protein
MPNQPLPEKLQRRFKVNTVDEMWYKNLTEGNIRLKQYRHIYGMFPSNPRCVNCHRPFTGIGGALFRSLQGVHKSDKNPRFCTGCYSFTTQFPGGAEIELAMLFVDVRGSTTIAEKMDTLEFSRLMNQTGLTWGNLSANVHKLKEAGCVDVKKSFMDDRPQTWVKLTEQSKYSILDSFIHTC